MRPWSLTVSVTARMRGSMSILRHLETSPETTAGKQKYKQMVYLEPEPIPVVRQSNVRCSQDQDPAPAESAIGHPSINNAQSFMNKGEGNTCAYAWRHPYERSRLLWYLEAKGEPKRTRRSLWKRGHYNNRNKTVPSSR
ncbi:hypothetical protein AB1N83_003808 [Pleurotus pulmonarius]